MSTIDIGIANTPFSIRAPGMVSPKPSPVAPIVAPPAPQDEDVFYIGSVKIDTLDSTQHVSAASPR